jgi:hypothetical protein
MSIARRWLAWLSATDVPRERGVTNRALRARDASVLGKRCAIARGRVCATRDPCVAAGAPTIVFEGIAEGGVKCGEVRGRSV